MATNRKIQTTELDFDGIKTSLKTYLQGQQQFSDYDFEGSGLSVLLDVLALNTHYNALYTNLAVNEAFLDSAAKRSSVVSKAKELGYVPKSATSATAVVTVLMLNDQISAPTTIEIPAYSPFATQVAGKTYTFYTSAAHTAQRSGNQYTFSDVELKEGTFLQNTYVYNSNTPIIIPNTGVDRSTINVTVQESAGSSNIETFTESATILNLSPTSAAYFLRELDDQTYQIEFGNDILGKAPAAGNIITVSYLVCSQDEPNGASSFTYGNTLPTATTAYVVTQTAAAGGAAPEDIESIRWNAPRVFTTQNRCVTLEDYRTIINSLYTPARSVSVWGGESATPPQYGKVFISIVPESLDNLTTAEKNYVIEEIVNPRKPLSITPVIVDPTYLRLDVHTTFYYNPRLTTRSASDIQALVRQTIQDYNDTYLSEFGGVFKFSKLGTLIDASEPAITSNITTITLHREITPVYGILSEYKIDLGNPIYDSGVAEESILSTGFIPADTSETCYIDDVPNDDGTGTGILRMFYLSTNNAKIVVKNVGTVDYSAGQVDIVDLNIVSLSNGVFELQIKPQSNDVVGSQEQFVTIDAEHIVVNAIAESAYKSYEFTSSRT